MKFPTFLCLGFPRLLLHVIPCSFLIILTVKVKDNWIVINLYKARPGSSVGCVSAWHAAGHGFDPQVRQYSFVEIGHEIISMAILSLLLIILPAFMSRDI